MAAQPSSRKPATPPGKFSASELLPIVYGELKRLAEVQLRHERAGHTLAPTALVHEAYLRLIAAGALVGKPSEPKPTDN